MHFSETVGTALRAIRTNKLRSSLTMLGIIIGVGAVITMVALGTGAQRSVQTRLQALGPDLLTIHPGQSFRGGVASQDRVSLTVDDAEALSRDGTALAAVVPELSRSVQLTRGNKNANVNVVGTTADYVRVKNYEIVAGRMFSPGDDEARQRYAVLGSAVPELFDTNGAAMVGQEIMIRGIPFEIIGVLGEKGSQGGWGNPDEQVLIPLQTARYRVHGSDRLRAITVKAADVNELPRVMVDIERVLRREHRVRPGMENDFQIRRQADILSTLEDTTKTFTRLLAGIAAVSLFVGGIGIMNIMLVSVTERTREIGLRKALGATRADILLQFLVEALVLCLLGGVVGIVVGSLGAVLLSRLNHWNTQVSAFAVGLAFLFSALVGIFFGIWPARRAARMDPIEALRHE